MCFFKNKNKIYPVVFKNNSNKNYTSENCLICLEKISYGACLLDCGHNYHSTCILKWFEKEMKCPLCKEKYQWAVIKKNKN